MPPDGLRYAPGFLGEGEAAGLVERFEALEFDVVAIRGTPARRTVRHFGYGYDFEAREVEEGEPIPDWLLPLRARCAELAGVAPEEFVQGLVTRYPPGATIGWHRDAPAFGSPVVGVSVLGACRMRFQRRTPDARLLFEIQLEPRSAYVLGGAARWSWQHSIPAVRELRYSVTFRTLRR